MFDVIDRGWLRARYAARAALGFFVVAAALGGFYFFQYEVISVEEPARYGFWLAAGALFIGLCAASTAVWLAARPRSFAVFFAASLGFLAGFFWCFAAVFPIGLFPGRFAVPIIVIWPLSAAFGFAYAESAQTALPGPRPPIGFGFLYALLSITWVFAVKGGIDRLGEQVDFARMIAERRYRDPSGLGIAAAPRGSCNDPAPARTAVIVDSAQALRPVGAFADLQPMRGRRPGYLGYGVELWQVDSQYVGVLTLAYGIEAEWREALLENVSFNPETGDLAFDAFYADGYFERFRGRLTGKAITGTLTTMDEACIRRVVSTHHIKLTREKGDGRFPFGRRNPARVADLPATFRRAYARVLVAARPEAPDSTSLLVPISNWVGPATGAARLEAVFADSTQRNQVFNDLRAIGSFDNQLWSAAQLLVRTERLDSGRTQWLVAGPLSVVMQYISRLQSTGIPGLRHTLVTPNCCSNDR